MLYTYMKTSHFTPEIYIYNYDLQTKIILIKNKINVKIG